MNAEDMISCCGGFCATCARSSSYTAFREAAALLAELIDAHGFHHWMPDTVEFNYNEFRKGLDFFADPDSWLVCTNACKGSTGGPPFCVRECGKQHEVDICFECSEFPCDRVKPFEGIVDKADEYRRLGREKWLQKHIEMAAQGFESHTGKYYQIRRSATAPEQ